MKCRFCQACANPTHYEMVTDSVASEITYKCFDCNATYKYSNEADCLYYYDFEMDGYRCIFYPDHMYGPEGFCLVKESTILELNYIPNINPQNFRKKLPTLLTFL